MNAEAQPDGFAPARAARPTQWNRGSFVTTSGRHRKEIDHE
jgi:hypothetical protein